MPRSHAHAPLFDREFMDELFWEFVGALIIAFPFWGVGVALWLCE